VLIGDPSAVSSAISSFVGGTMGTGQYWTVAKLTLVGKTSSINNLGTGWRLIGNHISAPQGTGPAGTIAGTGNDLSVIGNEITNCGSNPTFKLYHPIYISAARATSGARLPTESNREIAWNYLHDNIAHRGINIYSEGASSALMENHSVHDNVIVDQSGVGILIGNMATKETLVYNNLVIRAGIGPDQPSDDPTGHVCLEVEAGHSLVPSSQTLVRVYHNTFYGCGQSGLYNTGVYMGDLTNATLEMRNNIFVSTVAYAIGSSMPPAGTGSHDLWFGLSSAPSFEVKPLTVDPLVIDATKDFRLQNSSPARAAGATGLTVAPYGLDGTLRPTGTAPDLGAY
jgi:hypothetical protein